jgi:HSP20 family molecular chaperone IbpA
VTRSLRLPAGAVAGPEGISAQYNDGVLKVSAARPLATDDYGDNGQ